MHHQRADCHAVAQSGNRGLSPVRPDVPLRTRRGNHVNVDGAAPGVRRLLQQGGIDSLLFTHVFSRRSMARTTRAHVPAEQPNRRCLSQCSARSPAPLRNVLSTRVVATLRDTSRVDANNCHTTGVTLCDHLRGRRRRHEDSDRDAHRVEVRRTVPTATGRATTAKTSTHLPTPPNVRTCIQRALGSRSRIGDRPLVADNVRDGPLMLWRSNRAVICAIYRWGQPRYRRNTPVWAPSHRGVRWICYGRPRIFEHRYCCPACRRHL